MSPLNKRKLSKVRLKLDNLDNKLIKLIRVRTNLVNEVLKLKEHKKMVAALKVGDEIATSGGIYGKITKLTDTYAMLKISSNSEIKLQRNSINQILPKNTIDHIK